MWVILRELQEDLNQVCCTCGNSVNLFVETGQLLILMQRYKLIWPNAMSGWRKSFMEDQPEIGKYINKSNKEVENIIQVQVQKGKQSIRQLGKQVQVQVQVQKV